MDDPQYPSLLKTLPGAPKKLYVTGDVACLSEPSVAIVGSRDCTAYGETAAGMLAEGLAEAGLVTVSGLARGIDTAAHWGSLKARGKTIAVMGTGPDMIFPKENAKLAREISEQGALVTEFEPGTPGYPGNFPMRNRIIACLALGTVVVEAAFKSGALITARLAAEQGREVFAVPGPITSPVSEGSNRLLSEGAKLVSKAQDILEEFEEFRGFKAELKKSIPRNADAALTAEEQELLNLISLEPVSIDQLLVKFRLGSGRLSNTLLSLELKGAIRALRGKRYAKIA